MCKRIIRRLNDGKALLSDEVEIKATVNLVSSGN